ncbi:MAG: anthranilate synthase component I [Ignavibacteriae bacterium]|nr:anthranilate synthase component I [Ignavibacteriota bacterium]NOG97441.1 anthranilate synthase component I [Ignavibacteriota bacterium]
MNFEKFKILSQNYKLVPVYEKITADLLTPVLAFIKLRTNNKFCFLFESVEGIGNLARYSFIGMNPSKLITNKGKNIKVESDGKIENYQMSIFDYFKDEIKNFNSPKIDELPDFTGGIVGYLGFENVALIEDVIEFDGHDENDFPDSFFGVFENVIAFDHYKHQIILISNADLKKNDDVESAYKNSKEKLSKIKNELMTVTEHKSDFKLLDDEFANFDMEEFYKTVDAGKKNIFEGDVFQLVLSKRFSSKYKGDLLNVYRALRIINPSPYMYFMQFDEDLTVIGTSPEDLIKVKDNKAAILPIAGTRRRGKTKEEDIALEKELLGDPKEIAEHQMLVDLARNDLGRVCNYDSVKLTEEKSIHRFSHVMHIVSRVEGELKKDKDCVDALTASFPAGTVSGAPKIRAIQLINEYEKLKRNIYAGAIGYIDFSGNLDLCIAIRTLFADKKKIYWQAGAGIVADSQPELELKEIYNKSKALLSALKFAGEIDESINN